MIATITALFLRMLAAYVDSQTIMIDGEPVAVYFPYDN